MGAVRLSRPVALPLRLKMALALLEPVAGLRILEVGCAGGALMARLCQRIGTGSVVGVDRSGGALARAARALAGPLAAGRARLVEGDIRQLDPGGPFDRIVAVNFNLFWRGPGDTLHRLARCLAAEGRLVLVLAQPGPGQQARAMAGAKAAVEAAGLEILALEKEPGTGWMVAGTVRRS